MSRIGRAVWSQPLIVLSVLNKGFWTRPEETVRSGLLSERLWRRVPVPPADVLIAVCVATGYYASAQLAFFIGTLSDRIFAPFWPPNVILFCGLLLSLRKHWTLI